MKYDNIREEEIKNSVATDFFGSFDCDKIVGFIDFAVKPHPLLLSKFPHPILSDIPLQIEEKHGVRNEEYFLWAEAKTGNKDICAMLAQLVLTIGKARTFDKYMPPKFLGCFDGEKIAFVPYHKIQDIFYQNDFNWNVTPSNHETREFKQVYAQVKSIVSSPPSPLQIGEGCPAGRVEETSEVYFFNFEKDKKDLRRFIRENFILGKSETTKLKIDKNNFKIIFNKWTDSVMPSIGVNWDSAKKNGIIAGDFYLADLLSDNNKTLKEKLFILLKSDYYEADRHLNDLGLFTSSRVEFKDEQKAHTQFWNRYERPPRKDYWDFIINRRDLLVPPDVRERKGSFFTPKIWVELSQKYIADVLGEDWQDEYYVWDCAAGTGNLLEGLTNKYNIWASTLDKADIDVMHDRIDNGANMLHNHVFQFDFLNDDFSKLPQSLQKIINDEEKRKKLVVYINPPYAEAASKETVTGTGENKMDVAVKSKIYCKYINTIGIAGRELFAQFLIRVYCEMPGATLANFSTLKNLQAPNFENFRNIFLAKLEKLFVCPAYSFDNVNGKFPIGFMIWNSSIKEKFKEIIADVYNQEGKNVGTKCFSSHEGLKSINDWLISTRNRSGENKIGFISCKGSDFQNTGLIFIINDKNQLPHPRGTWITDQNIFEASIYYSVRHCIEATWLNDRDQFLYPNDGWQTDTEFQNNCFTYTLFSNNISSKHGANHWIPFTEYQVAARDKFDSNYMTDFMAGKTSGYVVAEPLLFYHSGSDGRGNSSYRKQTKLEFSDIAKIVFSAGRELWKYYHSQENINVNASLYDIREYFQGRNEKGKMNNKSEDENYNELIGNLREKLKILAQKIEPKVYEYGFLKK